MTSAAKRIDVTEDLVPIGHFKTHASEHIRRIHATGRPMVITQNGRAAAVVLTPEDFEELGHRAFVRAKIDAGLRSAETEPTYTPAEVEAHVLGKIRAAARRPAVEPARRPAVEPARRPAVEPARRPAVEPARRPAVEPARRPATAPTRRSSPAQAAAAAPAQAAAAAPARRSRAAAGKRSAATQAEQRPTRARAPKKG